MGFDGVAIAGEGYVDERFALQELIEDVGEVRLVVVPAKAELLRRSRRVLHRYLQVQYDTRSLNDAHGKNVKCFKEFKRREHGK